MLQSVWHLFSWLFSRATCQGPAEAKENEAKEAPAPSSEDQGPQMLEKPLNKGANPSERRPTIVLVVGPAEQFTQISSIRLELADMNATKRQSFG
ncbi:hypothetical protein JD844_004992 [Phrynosoma platyrhinos]|uniref:Uncharacterized protein n=1 Tax=Phrynosoma platyrhinos TaxID=52577 RepID=A0ABQ7SDZ5_PHRPL|nr:hypothetical protein JD844_004992 [Phrynosoma platyrhinos]